MSSTCKRTICLLSGLLLCTSLSAQPSEIRFERLSVDQGLSQSSGRSMVQDHRGFLWVGTEDGLNKYDGIAFKIYRHDPADSTSIAANSITSLCEDSFGGLWIALGAQGLDRLDLQTENFSHYGGLLSPSEIVLSIHEDKNGTLWLGTTLGLRQFIRDERKFILYSLVDKELDARAVNLVFADSHGRLWLGVQQAGLLTFNRQTKQFERIVARTEPDRTLDISLVSSCFEDAQGQVWFGAMPAGIIRYNPQADRFKAVRPSHSPNGDGVVFARDLASDHQGNVWIAPESRGVLRLASDGKATRLAHDPLEPGSLSSDVVVSLLVDRAGTVWVGTAGGGINKYDPYQQKFAILRNTLRQPEALRGNMIWSIMEAKDGSLWIGTQSGGLNHYDWQRGRFEVYMHEPGGSKSAGPGAIYALCEGPAGKIWVGTAGRGLNVFDPASRTFDRYAWQEDRPDGIGGNWIRSLLFDRDGSLWVGLMGRGLDRLDPQSNTFGHFVHDPEDSSSLSNASVTVIFQDSQRRIWVGTSGGGLNLFHPITKSFTRYLNDAGDKLSADHVMAICEAPGGTLWVGGTNGLRRFDPDKRTIETYTTADGLPNNVIYGILADSQNHIWLSSNKGLTRLEPGTNRVTNYDLDDGLQSREFNAGVAFRGQSGLMYFGGVNGLNYFHPDSIRDNPNLPPVAITAVKRFDETIAFRAGEPIELSHKDDFITIEFVALNFTNAVRNQYVYRLEGFNDDWIACGSQRYATFTNLEPGDYVFQVRGSNNDGIWNEAGASLRLTVLPPFWQTWWFRTLIALLFISTLAFFVIAVRWRERRKTELNRKITELKLQALRAQMNPHFVFNTINSIQYFISSNEPKAAYRYLSRFSKLMRSMLENAEKSCLTLAEELESLKLYLELEQLRFEGKFSYKLDVDPGIDIHHCEIPTMLIQPFVENAIHHGLKFKRSKGDLWIKLQRANGSLVCTIEDNGIGINKARAMNGRNGDRHKPTGMKVTRERLETMNALTRTGRGIEVVDLSEKNGQGTRVKIVIPVEES